MTYQLLIQGARLVSSETEGTHGDVGIVDGRIAEIGDLQHASAEQVLDARGLVAIPGVIDTQVHFREPSDNAAEDLESGTRAAICGGVTTVFEMPNTQPPTTTPQALKDKLRRAEGRAWCDHAFFFGAAKDNLDDLAECETLPGTPGIKMFMGSSTGTLLVSEDEDVRKVLRNGRFRCAVHSEDEKRLRERSSLLSDAPHPREHPHRRDAEAARLNTERLLRLAAEIGRPVHVLHVSTLDETPLLANAKKLGQDVTCEVTPQHLWFSAEDYERLGSLLQMNPPIRAWEHRDALWAALKDGLFDVFGSDHAPHLLSEKAKPYPQSPSGLPGVQTLLPAFLTFASQGRISLQDVVKLGCENPARIYGVRGKGHLKRGFDADVTLIDPDRRYTFEQPMVESKCGWSPFLGETFVGAVEHVVLRGSLAVRDGCLVGSPRGEPVAFER